MRIVSAERTPEAAPDPCVVCGHELWCHQREGAQPSAWNCNGHGPVCVRFASTIAAAEAKVLVERAIDQPPLIAAGLADQVAPDPRTLADYIPCPKPVTFSTDRSAAVVEEHWTGPTATCQKAAARVSGSIDVRGTPLKCRASWAEFSCDKPAGHRGKHHTFDGAHSWYQMDVPGLDASRTTVAKLYGIEPAPLHRLGEVPRALRALASQIAFGSSKPGRTVGDWRPAYSSAQGRSELIDKILRHALALAAGELLDEDGRPHAAAVLADTAFLLELEGGS